MKGSGTANCTRGKWSASPAGGKPVEEQRSGRHDPGSGRHPECGACRFVCHLRPRLRAANWQNWVHLPQWVCSAAQQWGTFPWIVRGGKLRIPIHSDNPKAYLAVGNCLMGHIDGPDAMALAWMNNAGVDPDGWVHGDQLVRLRWLGHDGLLRGTAGAIHCWPKHFSPISRRCCIDSRHMFPGAGEEKKYAKR